MPIIGVFETTNANRTLEDITAAPDHHRFAYVELHLSRDSPPTWKWYVPGQSVATINFTGVDDSIDFTATLDWTCIMCGSRCFLLLQWSTVVITTMCNRNTTAGTPLLSGFVGAQRL